MSSEHCSIYPAVNLPKVGVPQRAKLIILGDCLSEKGCNLNEGAVFRGVVRLVLPWMSLQKTFIKDRTV